MISEKDVQTYQRDGVIVVPEVLGADTLAQVRSVIAELVAGSAKTLEHTDVYDLEPGHTAESPRVRRIKTPHKVHTLFDEIVRSEPVLDILKKLLGPGLRLHGSKLNMKSAQYGSPVEWHQDWAFYPHTNDDVLAIGVLLDDCDLANGPMLVTPGTHNREVWNHHGDDGCFAGLIDPDIIKDEIERAVPCMGRAGSMSFHHVRALARLGDEHLGPAAQSAALRSRGERRLAADGREGFRRVQQPAAVGRAGDRAADDQRAGAPAAAAGQAAGIDLRNPVRGKEILFYPRGLKLANAPVPCTGADETTLTTIRQDDKKSKRGKR